MTSPSERPNLLVIMSDEHAPQFSGVYGHPLVKTPNLDRLAAEGVVFENAYCNSPLCSPSRMSFMTGRYVHNLAAWDNSTSLSSDEPTWAHRMRSVGYDVVLSGKQHFVGSDQLHGFREQLARDLHAEIAHEMYLWNDGTPPAAEPWKHMATSGPGRTTEIEVDDQVERAALTYIHDPDRKNAPWVLNAAFIAPHFPFIVPQEFWDLYPLETIDLPVVPRDQLADTHPVYLRMAQMFGLVDFPEETVRRAKAGYYGLITWLDEKIGRLLQALDETGQRDNTIIVYVSDHGEMAGEHGLWRKSNFREHSARIPMLISWPRRLPSGRRIPEVVSLVDMVATMLDLTESPLDGPLDGESLLPLMSGQQQTQWKNEAFCEYLAHGVTRPMAMLRHGTIKLNYFLDDPVELFDLESDPGERRNLASDEDYAQIREELRAALLARWDPVALEQQVIASQRARHLIQSALPAPAAYH